MKLTEELTLKIERDFLMRFGQIEGETMDHTNKQTLESQDFDNLMKFDSIDKLEKSDSVEDEEEKVKNEEVKQFQSEKSKFK